MSKWLSAPSKTLIILQMCLVLSACDKGEKPYDEAEALFNSSDYAAAKNKAVEVIEKAPKSKYLAQATELIQKIDKIEKLLQTGQADIENGDYEKGIGAYKDVLLLDPNNKMAAESKQKAEAILSEITQMESEGGKQARIDGLIIKVTKAEANWMKNERGERSRFPSIEFKVVNNTPYHVKVYSAEIQYSYHMMYGFERDSGNLYLDHITLNKTVPKGRDTIVASLSKYGMNPPVYIWSIYADIELTTSIGKFHRSNVQVYRIG